MDKQRIIQYQSEFDKTANLHNVQNISIYDHFRDLTKMIESNYPFRILSKSIENIFN